MEEKLNKILKSMNEEVENTDTEIAHGVADDLLVELVELLSKRSKFRKNIEEILKKYHSVSKWYAEC